MPVALPVLVTVITIGLVCPVVVFGKLAGLGVMVNTAVAGAVPVPVRLADAAVKLPPTCNTACSPPMMDGLNVIDTAQDPELGLRVVPLQVLDPTMKSGWLVPEVAALAMVPGAVPVLVTVKTCAPDTEPTVTLPKLLEAGEMTIWAAPAVATCFHPAVQFPVVGRAFPTASTFSPLPFTLRVVRFTPRLSEELPVPGT